ncbi:MAG: hypothetical protein SNI45_00805 [Rikenellaceae bacterium]
MRKLIIFGLLLFIGLTTASAQPQGRNHQGRNGGDFEKFQLKLLSRQLDIEESQQEAFEAIYTEYSDKMKSIRPSQEDKTSSQNEKPSDEIIEQQILDSFDMAEMTTALKREYYERFKEVLTPHQILRMYNIERQLSDRIHSEIENRGKATPPEGAPAPRR